MGGRHSAAASPRHRTSPHPPLLHPQLPAGLLLYAADVALRAGQMANLTTVTAAKVERAAGVVTVQMKVDPVRCFIHDQ